MFRPELNVEATFKSYKKGKERRLNWGIYIKKYISTMRILICSHYSGKPHWKVSSKFHSWCILFGCPGGRHLWWVNSKRSTVYITMSGFLDSSPKSLKYEFWILKFFMGLNYSWLLVLSYGISHIHLKSCGLTQESAEDDPFSTFCLIWTNSISRKVRKKIIIPKPGNFGIKTQLFLDQRGYGH